jgi:hypothetical protein
MHKRTFTYPGSDFDRSRNLIAALGSFWSRIYEASDQIESYATGTALVANQTYLNLLEVVAATSRYDTPLFHTEYITPIVLRRSAQNSSRTSLALFDRTTAAFDGKLFFDVPENTELFSFPLPDKLVNVQQLFNRITFPTAVLVKNVDFTIDLERRAIIFRTNPFDNAAFLKRPVTDAAAPDEEITLWGFRGQFDYDFVFEQFAYTVGLRLQTSQGYKDLTNAIISGLVEGGATAAIIDTALAAICGLPVSLEPQETVEVVTHDAAGLLIVTDKNVYRFPENAVASVAPEQHIVAGTPLVTAIEITEFFIGNAYIPNNSANDLVCCPAPNDTLITHTWEAVTTENNDDIILDPTAETCPTRRPITALALDNSFIAACFYSDLVFENRIVPLEIDSAHPSDYTYIKFRVGGHPADVEYFFDEIHARGIAAAQSPTDPCHPTRRKGTLAHLLDRRVNPEGEPTAQHLPTTINPLRFLVENVLRNNVFTVRILVSALGQNRLGLYNIRHLRQLLPPQTAMLVIFELDADKDVVNAESQLNETVTYFRGMTPVTDTLTTPQNVVDLGATARLISGTCQ